MIGPRALLSRLKASVSGVATTELALAMPFFLTAGLWGIELANYSVVTMRVNQLAVHMADNASRIGDQSQLANRKIYEADINDLLKGASLQGGGGMALFDHGRVIISSLEVNSDDDQFIHWQRCMGLKNWPSSYGAAGDVMPNGMGPSGEEVIAFDEEAVMFVELVYDYQPLISKKFVGKPTIHSIASFTVRADRDLSGVFQRSTTSPDPVADCASLSNPYSESAGGGGAMTTSGGASSGGGGASSGGASSGGASSGGASSTGGDGSSTTTSSGGGGSTGGGSTTTSGGSGGSGGGSTTTSGGSGGSGGGGSNGGSSGGGSSTGGTTSQTTGTTSGGGGAIFN